MGDPRGITATQPACSRRWATIKSSVVYAHTSNPRSTNSFDDLVAGMKIDLLSAKPGTPVSLGFDRPTDGLKEAVNSFVETFNSMKAVIDEATDYVDGTLKQDSAVRAMPATRAPTIVVDGRAFGGASRVPIRRDGNRATQARR